MLFKEIIAVYTENTTEPINTERSVTGCYMRWHMQVALHLEGLRRLTTLKGLVLHNLSLLVFFDYF
jgi:hypothetical protein